MGSFTSVEICAGGGGQVLGLEQAGFDPVLLLDEKATCCETLSLNRPKWQVVRGDLRELTSEEHPEILDVDLLSGGVPCSPYSSAGRQEGNKDARDLLEAAIYLAYEVRPRAIMIENTADLVTKEKFASNRKNIIDHLEHLGYAFDWQVLDAQNFGVPQRRRSSVLVAMLPEQFAGFTWPDPVGPPPSVAEVLFTSMNSRGWPHAERWAAMAADVAPTIVGGSDKHGGADLGPSRSKAAWERLGVNGTSLAEEPPGPDFGFETDHRAGLPKLTVDQVALLQGFPDSWRFAGKKTAKYRMVGNSFPPPVARAVGEKIASALAIPFMNSHNG
ncbi:DNA (cytosine-5-)-methyltransferase [Actinocorallia libanotica]|uniref:Cytosine-specific methyltransferase n=1 Tax=Actinocorallia libanotica TaxID=46162 RepID=A0ABN1R8T8_9ACTN